MAGRSSFTSTILMPNISLLSALLALAAAFAAGLVGGFAQLKRIILAGDVMSHIALPGLGLAFLYGVNPLIGGAATLFIGVVLIWHLEKKTGLTTDTTIGVIFAASVALGALLTPEGDLIDALFGGFKNPSPAEFAIGLLVTFAVIAFIVAFRHRLILAFFSPELAAATRVNVSRVNFFFLLAFGATIMLGLQFLGALLVGSLIIIPAAIARQMTHRLELFMAISAGSAVAATAAGLLISSHSTLPLGPTIVAAASALFGLSLLKKIR